MGPMHIADTYEQAKENARFGLHWVFNYLSHIIPVGTGHPRPTTTSSSTSMNATGRGVIGTPEMAIAQIERLIEQSGGFGCYLFLGADIADWRATVRHYELVAEQVMPHFAGQLAAGADGVRPGHGRRHEVRGRHARTPSSRRWRSTRPSARPSRAERARRPRTHLGR